MSSKSTYKISPFGIAVHCHLNEPDAKFTPDNPMFKTKLKLSGEEAVRFRDMVDVECDAAFAAFFKEGSDGHKLTPAERKKFSTYRPYEVEEDDAGNPTGAILFDFKQNAKIRLKDGTVKEISMPILDASDKPTDAKVITGSEIRIMYSMRPIPMKSLKQVGVRLDFAKVQVRKLAERTGGGAGGFGETDGFVDEHAGNDKPGFGPGQVSSGGDY